DRPAASHRRDHACPRRWANWNRRWPGSRTWGSAGWRSVTDSAARSPSHRSDGPRCFRPGPSAPSPAAEEQKQTADGESLTPFLDLRQDGVPHVFRLDVAGMVIADDALGIDQKALRGTVDAEIKAQAAVGVEGIDLKGVAELVQKLHPLGPSVL